ncbi:MAG: hypothetical protein HC777_02910 [Hyphomonadaceae bacterium]|nr:hypothetical protein [Hyphomonadaceae bacterium]
MIRRTDQWPKLLDQIVPDAGYERAFVAAFGDDLSASMDQRAPITWHEGHGNSLIWPQGTDLLCAHVANPPAAIKARLAAIAIVDKALLKQIKRSPMVADWSLWLVICADGTDLCAAQARPATMLLYWNNVRNSVL